MKNRHVSYTSKELFVKGKSKIRKDGIINWRSEEIDIGVVYPIIINKKEMMKIVIALAVCFALASASIKYEEKNS